MAKRSDFKRVERDLYRTFDKRAVAPLMPHIEAVNEFAEPFCGHGDLVAQLQDHPERGVFCCWKSDIEPMADLSFGLACNKMDFRQVTAEHIEHADAVISNSPWQRGILHEVIDHFRVMKPLWLLLDSNWMFTKQAAPYLRYCEKIVTVGRLKWIPGTKDDGKDDCAWYLFKSYECETKFYGRQV